MTAHQNASVVRTVTLVSIAMFAVLAIAVIQGWTEEFDQALLLMLRDGQNVNDPLGPAWVEETIADITVMGGYPLLTIFAIVTVGVLTILRLKAAALFLAVSLIGGSILSTVLKQVFARPRPDIVDHVDRVFTSSFPSAHAMVSTVAWMTLAAIALRFVTRHSLRVFLLIAAATITIMVGLSRVYLGVHWPSDIAAGWCVGLAWAGFCWLIARHIETRTGAGSALGHSRM